MFEHNFFLNVEIHQRRRYEFVELPVLSRFI